MQSFSLKKLHFSRNNIKVRQHYSTGHNSIAEFNACNILEWPKCKKTFWYGIINKSYIIDGHFAHIAVLLAFFSKVSTDLIDLFWIILPKIIAISIVQKKEKNSPASINIHGQLRKNYISI